MENIKVIGGEMSPEEQAQYLTYLEQKFPNCLVTELELTITKEGDEEFVDMKYKLENKPETNVPMSRIRRITGYLVGGMERWNNAKKSEEGDRVKHGVVGCDIGEVI